MSKRDTIRCLKRYVAREIFRVMKNPQPIPLTNDLRPLRLAMGLTQVTAPAALLTWPSTISRIERGKTRDRDDIARYRTWLEEQAEESS